MLNKIAFTSALATVAVMSGAASAQNFSLSIPDLKAGKFTNEQFLSETYGFGCSGDNASPRLTWSGAPAGTRSFVLTVYDKDAPTGFGWVHWVVANIPGNAIEIARGITSDGVGLPAGSLQTRTDFGVPGYGGPCPPQGSTHNYVITLTALKVDKLPDAVTQNAPPALVGFFTKANSLGEATLVVNQGR
ncbi:YbhB/YbcL family Raf kinase inhibitor-like protein [Azospirillum canadense]|uniref:YbhB/YbcL family Raf kinase inhibitor-like protein n=1 Tax=Azospirillum canadense TaxID=403962 RepID=UPI002225D7DE|nr:YbhB/YbcL family Raf kinase inhibitor-like protein [Azospirillum canadense]MCW2240528.1 Raf kinase inhibitor-like YbhB/YbcL family protein [Azospirillum canadense]